MKAATIPASVRALLALLTLSFSLTHLLAQKLPDANDTDSIEVRHGIAAYKASRYSNAIDELKMALVQEPNNEKAHLYIGYAYAQQFIPDLAFPENLKFASNAIAEFDIVLQNHPNDLILIKQEAGIYRDTSAWDKARELAKRAEAIDPLDPEPPFMIGQIDWRQAYKNADKILGKENLTDDGVGNVKLSRASCESMRATNSTLVDDAIVNLNHALQLKPDYADAMAYLNLAYRRRADLHCGAPAAVQADVKRADQWFAKASALKTFLYSPDDPPRSWNPMVVSHGVVGGIER